MRKSAEQRREEILAIGMEHFAAGGYHGTSTEGIAREAGISHAYLFRLFRTKRELFLACGDLACQKVLESFRRAADDAPPGEELQAMGQAYVRELLPDRHAILMLMQSYAAGGADPAIREHVRHMYGEVVSEVTELAGAGPDDAWSFFASGMLLNIVAALDLQESDHPVFRAWTASPA
jgi:AcrR family transcriptional regulator